MNKTPIRALILDYGGVISLPQDITGANSGLRGLKSRYGDFEAVYRRHRAHYDDGQWSGREYWTNVLRQLGHASDEAEMARLIEDDVASWTHVNEAVIQFVQECKRKGLALAIISNMTWDSLAYLKAHPQWLGLFDELVFSCDVGVNKPAREVYALCLNRLGLPPAECLFVDDSPENVRGAQAVGMAVIQFKTLPDFLRELDERFSLTVVQ